MKHHGLMDIVFNKGVNCQHSIRLDVWMGLRGSSGACRGSGVLCGRLKGSLSVSEDSSTRTELKMVILKINIKPTGIWFIFWIKFIHSLKWLRDCHSLILSDNVGCCTSSCGGTASSVDDHPHGEQQLQVLLWHSNRGPVPQGTQVYTACVHVAGSF